MFVNGRTALAVYRRYFEAKAGLSSELLPSSSPANASISYAQKLEKWRRVQKILES